MKRLDTMTETMRVTHRSSEAGYGALGFNGNRRFKVGALVCLPNASQEVRTTGVQYPIRVMSSVWQRRVVKIAERTSHLERMQDTIDQRRVLCLLRPSG